MATSPLAHPGSAVKCPFGRVGFPVALAKRSLGRSLFRAQCFLEAFSKVSIMTFILILLIGGFAIAAATALIRGLMAFFRDAELIRQNEIVPREPFGLQQNRMMTQRVLFQGIAILLVVLLGALTSQR